MDHRSETPASGPDVVDVAKDAARATFDAVSAQASALAGSVAAELAHSGDEQKQRGVETMRGFAGAVKKAADDVGGQSPAVARQLRVAAEKVETLSDSLRQRNVKELLADASDLARRQPAAFFAGSIAAGFALARFLKSSALAPPKAAPAAALTDPSPPAAAYRPDIA